MRRPEQAQSPGKTERGKGRRKSPGAIFSNKGRAKFGQNPYDIFFEKVVS